jgi:site-specific DNA recombinase
VTNRDPDDVRCAAQLLGYDGRFDVSLAEALDRISRDQEHIAGFHRQITVAGLPVTTIDRGAIWELHVGLKSTMAAMFLKDLARKTYRGVEGRVRSGRSSGGLCYAYRDKRDLHANGTPKASEVEIDADEAATVRRASQPMPPGNHRARLPSSRTLKV